MTDVCVCVFAKAPVQGKVKTRLLPALTEQQACLVHKKLLRHCLETVQSNNWQSQLWTTDIQHPYVKQHAQQNLMSLHLQQGHDLGERMLFAAKESLDKYAYVIIIGTDCPDLDSDYISKAIETLRAGTDVVIGPAKDGGYVLIGMSVVVDNIFKSMQWGNDQVLAITRERLQQAGIYWQELATLHDIDRPNDLALLESGY